MSTDRIGIRLQVDIDVLQWFAQPGNRPDYREHMALILRQHVDEMLEIEAAVRGERKADLGDIPVNNEVPPTEAEKDRIRQARGKP